MSSPCTPFEKNYKAFISYAHADNRERDRKWADWLHHALETYQVPAELVGQANQHGSVVPERIYPVFQDEKELSANASLSASLNSALDRSEFLVYLSSPRSARSLYVQEEIRHFKRTGRGNRIVTLIVRGEPEYGEVQSENQCFPDVLRFAVNDTGEIDFSRHDEALAADARLPGGEEGYTSEAAYRDTLQRDGLPARQARQKAAEYAERLNLAKLKIVSTILGVPLAELTQRDQAYQLEQVKRKNRTIKKVAAVMAVLALIAAAAGFFAWQQKNAAQRNLAQSLYVSGINKLAQNEYGEPAAYIAAAVRAGSRNAAQLAESMLAAKQDMVVMPNIGASLAAFSPDGRHVVGFANKGDGQFGLQIWDTATRSLREEVPELASQNPARPLFDAQNRVYVRSHAGIWRQALDGGQAENLHAGEHSLLAVSPDGRFLILRDVAAGQLQWLDVQTQSLRTLQRDLPNTQTAGALFSDAGTQALLWAKPDAETLSGMLITLDPPLDTQRDVSFSVQADIPQRLRFSADGRHVLLISGSTFLLLDSQSGASRLLGTQKTFYRWADFNPDGQTLLAVHAQGHDVYSLQGQRLASHRLPSGQLIAALEDDSERSPDQLQRLITLNKQLHLGRSAHDNLLIGEMHWPADTRQVLADAQGRHVLALTADGLRIERVDVETHARQDDFITLPEESSYIQLVGQHILMVVSRERRVRFYRADDGRSVGQAVSTQSRSIRISRDHSRFLARTDEDGFGIWRIADGHSVLQYRHPHTLDKFSTDEDFRYLITAGETQWQLIEIASGQIVLSVDETLSNAAFSPDSRFLAVAKTHGQSDVYALDTLQKSFSLPTIAAPRLGFSPDGKVLLASQDTTRLRLWHTESGRAYGPALPVMADPQLLAFSDDSQRLFLQDYSGEGIAPAVKIIDTESGSPVSLPLMQGVYRSIQLLDDGRRLAASEYLPEGHTLRLWHIPQQQNLRAAQLAADLEAFYGRKYDPQSGAINAYHGQVQLDSWYFQNIYTRPVAPGARTRTPEAIARLLPAHSEEHLQQLLSLHFYHPLAKAGLAEYFNRQAETRALAIWLAALATRQMQHIDDAALRQQIQHHLPEFSSRKTP